MEDERERVPRLLKSLIRDRGRRRHEDTCLVLCDAWDAFCRLSEKMFFFPFERRDDRERRRGDVGVSVVDERNFDQSETKYASGWWHQPRLLRWTNRLTKGDGAG
jgi:hypothetical protein